MGANAGLLARGGAGHFVGAGVAAASVFTMTLVLGEGLSADFSGVLARFSVFIDSFSGDADFLSDFVTLGFSGESGFMDFSGLAVLSELASGFSTRVSVLWRLLTLSALDGRPALLFVGVFTDFPFEVSPFLTFRFLFFFPLAPLFLNKLLRIN